MYPILFELGSVIIYSLWFFVTVGFIVGSVVFTNLCKQNRVAISLFTDNALSIFLTGLVFGRLTYVLFHWSFFFFSYDVREVLGLLGIWDKGISFWGTLIGVIFALYRKRKNTEEPLMSLLDQLTPAVLVGMLFGEFGAFLDGSLYGSPTTLSIGVTFKSAYVKYISPIHPTQLYAMFYTALIFILTLHLLKKSRSATVHGIVTELAVTLMSACIFIEEFFRGDDVFTLFGIRIGMYISAIIFGIGAYHLRKRIQNPEQNDPDGVLRCITSPLQALGAKFGLKSKKLPVQ